MRVARAENASGGWRWVGALCGALTVLLCLTASAQAARVHELLLSETLPREESPLGVAVNQVTHGFYATSFLFAQTNAYRFQEDGQLDPVRPELTGAPTLRPYLVAIDNSGGADEGYAWVSDLSDGTVQQFDPAGTATAVTITEASIPANGTAQGGGLPPVVNTGTFTPVALTVDPAGNVFVVVARGEAPENAIDEFTPAGVFVAQLKAGSVTGGTEGIAADSSGHIYLANHTPDGLGKGLFELSATTGECVQVGCTPIDPTPAFGVAVDDSRGKVFTTGPAPGDVERVEHGLEIEHGALNEYEAGTGELLGKTQPPSLHSPHGVAVEEASGKVIVADVLPEREGTVKVFGPEQTVPDVKTLAPEGITDRSVSLKGEVGGAGVAGATCIFQYVDQEGFEADRFQGAAEAPCEPAGPFSGTAMNAVQAEAEGLRGGTWYHERILGSNENGSNPGEDVPFETHGPSVSGTEAVEVGEAAATLKAAVDPNGAATTYRFQYLTEAQFDASGWTDASEVPVGGESIGAGGAAVAVSRRIEGLEPATAYRLRVVAESTGAATAGTTEGEEVPFTTFAPSGGLPDGRRYEQASPVDKNGANAEGEFNAVQASPDGDRITFFSSAGIPGGEGEQDFPSYLATRAPDGSAWSTQGLLPPASAGPRARIIGWTEGLGETYEFATQPFEGGKLYARSSEGGGLTEVAGVADSPTVTPFALAATSRGGAVAIIESKSGGISHAGTPLPDLPGKANVYAYDRESGRLVVAGVMNDGSVPAGGAGAGGGGSVKVFTQAMHVLSSDGSRAFFTARESGQLYVRLNPLAAQSAMSGEECTEPVKACTIRVSAPEEGVPDPETAAAFLGASADGEVVYFLDRGKLTADATGGTGYDLYRYDVAGGELTDLSLDPTDKNGARVEGMLGIGGEGAEEGRDAYFVAAGTLAAGATQAPAGETNLYALHGSSVEFLVRLGTGEAEANNWIRQSAGNGGEGTTHTSRVSRDGHVLLLTSTRRLTPYRNHGKAELYLYREGGGIGCISCNPSGEAPGGPAGVQQIPLKPFALRLPFAIMTQNISADGRRVIFDSADQLVAADHNHVNDVYEWEADGKGSCASEAVDGGCLFLISGGVEGVGPSFFASADEEGENVFFFTAQRLVAQDKDELIDVYDARVGGGIAAQEASTPTPCAGEAQCRPPVSGASSSAAPRSPTVSGANVKPPHRCKKGKVRRHGRCVKKHAKRHRRHRQKHHHGKRRHGKKDNRVANFRGQKGGRR